MATRITFRMIPAVGAQFEGADVGDIGSVPALSVGLVNKQVVVPCIGLIDTGADLSAVTPNLAQKLELHEAPSEVRVQSPLGLLVTPVHYIDIRIGESSEASTLLFPNVPVLIANSSRELFVIGRRGVLDRLKIELDFPRGLIVLTRSVKRDKRYPNLAEKIKSLDSIMSAIDSGHSTEGILRLSWEIEQFVDQLITENSDLRHARSSTGVGSRSFGDKLRLLEVEGKCAGIGAASKPLIDARNEAAHGLAFKRPNRGALQRLLIAADDVVGRLQRYEKSKVTGPL